MADPNWNRGFYYDGVPPHNGMKLARRESVSNSCSHFSACLFKHTQLHWLTRRRDRNDHLPLRPRMGAAFRSAHAF